MAKITNPDVEIEFGGKMRLLRMTFAELAALDDMLGGSAVGYIANGRMSSSFMLATLTCALRATNPTITKKYVAKIISEDPSKLKYYMGCINKAFELGGMMGVNTGDADDPDGDDAPEGDGGPLGPSEETKNSATTTTP